MKADKKYKKKYIAFKTKQQQQQNNQPNKQKYIHIQSAFYHALSKIFSL
jgi:hypothetical protein